MREIKFRAKIQGHTGFVFGVPHNVYENPSFDSIQYFEGDEILIEYIVAETLGQYTGKKDKNGVEIYEGDICKVKGISDLQVIECKGDYFAPSYSSQPTSILIEIGITVEVVGNIYDNPELINND